jgi:non-heme chloroperoxidase
MAFGRPGSGYHRIRTGEICFFRRCVMRETIMMIHGMWCGAWVWETYQRFFEARGFRCITPTLRHHEAAPGNDALEKLGNTSLLDYAQDLEEEIYSLDERPIIMGHSMGGLLAQILGSRGLAKALVLLTPASPGGIFALRPSVIRSFLSITTRPGFWKKPMRQTYGEAVYSMLGRMPASERTGIYEKLVPESGRAGFEIGFWPFDHRKSSRVEGNALTCPTLIVSGSEDKITPASVVRSIAAKYHGAATLKEFPGHAHWVMGEPGWERIAGYCWDWLDEVLVRLPARPVPLAAENSRGTGLAGRILPAYWGKWDSPGGHNRRLHPRRDAVVEVEAGIPYSGNAQSYALGLTANISKGGLYLDTDLSLKEGVHVNAGIHAGHPGRPVWVQCRVVRSSGPGLAMEITRGEKEKLGRIMTAS